MKSNQSRTGKHDEKPIPVPKTKDMNKVFKIDISDKVYIAAAMRSGRVFYAVSATFNGREQALLYCPRFDVLYLSIHGGQDFKETTQVRFLSEEPLSDVPTRIKRLFTHLDNVECLVEQVVDDRYYKIKPSTPFEEKDDE